ncbi:MAG: mediator complex subunit [Bogoriella megaspora]|nr:MAG: mediator complex subunit [Bogoriella megaspora]
MASAEKQWDVFVNNARQKRVRPRQFGKLAQLLQKRAPLSGSQITYLLLTRGFQASSVDPLLLEYMLQLLESKSITIPDILVILFYQSSVRPSDNNDVNGNTDSAPNQRQVNPLQLDEMVLYHVAKAVTPPYKPRSKTEAQRLITALTHWLNAAVTANTNNELLHAIDEAAHDHVILFSRVRDALSMLLLNILENRDIVSAMNAAPLKGTRQSFAKALSLSLPLLSSSSPQVGARVELLQKQHDIIDHEATTAMAGEDGTLGIDRMQLDTIIDVPAFDANRTRAGLYLYINAMLTGMPLTNDSEVLSHLNTRYKGEMQALTIDLIVASFDVLANAMARREPSDALISIKSFLVNKVTSLISMLSPSFFIPLTPEFCIEQALKLVDPNVFPSFSSSFNNSLGNESIMSDVRQEFLLACAVHGLVLENSIPRIYGEVPMSSIPTGGRYLKDDLVIQCQTNPQRLEELVTQIENMDGNAGAVVSAVTQVYCHLSCVYLDDAKNSKVMRNMCTTKETMSLKTICSSLSRRPHALDVTLQYVSATSILQPLCSLLDEYKYEEDQGEHQPVYEDFAGIFLLVLAMVHRYDLSKADLGVSGDQSFISQYLDKSLQSMSLNDLSPDQNNQLNSWICGLYQTESITEELMAACRPQDFYLLVPTLFDQTVLAGSSDAIKLDTIKTGLEFLLEPFLIPSLVGALKWIASELSHPGTNKGILIQILNKLMLPTSISGDAQGMHSTIIYMVADKLEKALRELQSRQPSMYNIEPLLENLKGRTRYKQTSSSSTTEVQTWTMTPSGGLRQSIRNTIQSLVSWGTHLPMIIPAPNYTHRQIIVATKLIGSSATLDAIIQEVKQQSQQNNGPLALDIAAEIISAPTLDHPPEIMTSELLLPVSQVRPSKVTPSLRDCLKVAFNDEAPKKLTSDPTTAETIVRLHRRIEAYAEAAAQQIPTGMGAQDMMQAVDLNAAVNSATADVDAAIAADAAAAVDTQAALDLGVSVEDAMNLDPVAVVADTTMDLDLVDPTAAATAGLGVGATQSVDDLFQQSANEAAALAEAGGLEGLDGGEDDYIFGELQLDPDSNLNFDDWEI